MSSRHYFASEYLAALPKVREAVRPLLGPHARMALVQVLAESIVEGAQFEAQVDPDARKRQVLQDLEAVLKEIRAVENRTSLTSLMISRKCSSMVRDD
jgi:hypothetical protein